MMIMMIMMMMMMMINVASQVVYIWSVQDDGFRVFFMASAGVMAYLTLYNIGVVAYILRNAGQ
jgi:hypothetical protein